MAHQSLTACISNLLDCGVIEIRSQKEDEDSTYSKYWYVELVHEILNNQKKRLRAKFEQWVKRGMKDFIQFMDEPTMLKLEIALVKLNEMPPLIDIPMNDKGQIQMFGNGEQ
jgi:transcription initiation factor IIE alpha subunit